MANFENHLPKIIDVAGIGILAVVFNLGLNEAKENAPSPEFEAKAAQKFKENGLEIVGKTSRKCYTLKGIGDEGAAPTTTGCYIASQNRVYDLQIIRQK
jgi:hypothetical protein